MADPNEQVRDECGDYVTPASSLPKEWVGDDGVAYSSPGGMLEANLGRLFRLGYERTNQGGPNWADPASYIESTE